MKIARLYTGQDQQSHFDEIEVPFGGERAILASDLQAASGVVFRCAPPGTVVDWHPAPRRQYVVTLAGEWDIECGDGSVRRFKPGDVMLAEDLSGRGHISRVVGNQPYIFMAVPLAEAEKSR
jgi:hypothetical protein